MKDFDETSKATGKKQRNRVPLSCLICKRRKVKCDKVKPACGGCVRNGVAHLCKYLEPTWAGKSPDNGISKTDDRLDIKLSTEYQNLRLQKDKTISDQRSEIENLRRQLEVVHNFDPKDDRVIECLQEVTVLSKLMAESAVSKRKIEIDESTFLIESQRSDDSFEVCMQFFNWVSVVRLDPYVTSLWYKISNLQKAYHLYKENLVTDAPLTSSKLKGSPSNTSCRSGSFRINEVDFTESFSSLSSEHKCPIAQCDLNLSKEQLCSSGTFKKLRLSELTTLTKSPSCGPPEQRDEGLSSDSMLLALLEDIWSVTLNILRGDAILKYDQLVFLLEFYFSNSKCFESLNLIIPFKLEIYATFELRGEVLQLSSAIPTSTNCQDSALYLSLHGIFLSMLSIAAKETLDTIRMQALTKKNDINIKRFKQLFPTEVLFLGLGFSSSKVLAVTEVFLSNISCHAASGNIKNSLPFISCCIIWCLYEIKRPSGWEFLIDSRRNLGRIVDSLFKSVLGKNSYLNIWADPALVNTEKKSTCKYLKELRLVFPNILENLLRLCNLICLGLINPLGRSDQIYVQVERVYRIFEVYGIEDQVAYLETLKGNEYQYFRRRLKQHHLVGKVIVTLRDAILSTREPRVTYSTILSYIDECNLYLNESETQVSNSKLDIELRAITFYLNLLLNQIMVIQAEEQMQKDLVAKYFVNQFVSFSKHLRDIDRQIDSSVLFEGSDSCLQIILEIIKCEINLFVGMLLRLDDNDRFASNLPLISKLRTIYYPLMETNPLTPDASCLARALQKDIILKITSQLELIGEKAISKRDNVKNLQRLWNLYCVFLKHYNKADYAKMHANVLGMRTADDMNSSTKCPIKFTNVDISKIKMHEHNRCPMSHNNPLPSTLSSSDIKNPNNIADVELSSDLSKGIKRKCPFGYDKPTEMCPYSGSINANESNIREAKFEEPAIQVCPFAKNNTTDIQAPLAEQAKTTPVWNPMNAPVAYPAGQLTQSQDPLTHAYFPQDKMWPEISDLDLEILGNGFLFDNVNAMNFSIEDLFR